MGVLKRFCYGLRIRLLMLVVLVCAPLVSLTIHQSSEQKRRAAQDWERRAADIASVAADEEAKLLRDTRQLLLSLGTYSGVMSGDWEGVRRFLEEELGRRPQYQNLGFLDTKGHLIVSAAPTQRTDYFATVFFRRTMGTRNFSGDRFSVRNVGRKATLDFGHPVYGPTGLIGVVFASLDLNWIDKFESNIRGMLHHKQTVWTEINSSGKVVYRAPAPENFVGKTLPETGLLDPAVSGRKDLLTWEDEQGIWMATAFATRESTMVGENVIGILTVPRDILFADANEQLWRNVIWIAGATLVALLLGWVGSQLLVLQPIRSLARASARLEAGDMTARTGLKHGHDELGQLTLAFDHMAEALEHREQERLKSAKKLQVLSHKLVEVQENERRLIARELHDEIGQSLTAAEMNLQAALQAPRSANVERRLAASMQAVEQVLEQVHDLSLNLRPSMLDDLGLEPALRWLTRRQAELAGVEADFRSDHIERRLHPVIETECFRIGQEALTNIVRHAKAKNVSVELTVNDRRLHLRVRDDGQGFDVGQQRGDAVMGSSLGLLSMEERAALAGGGITLTSSRGRGTEVHAWFPLTFDDEQLPDDFEETRNQLKII